MHIGNFRQEFVYDVVSNNDYYVRGDDRAIARNLP